MPHKVKSKNKLIDIINPDLRKQLKKVTAKNCRDSKHILELDKLYVLLLKNIEKSGVCKKLNGGISDLKNKSSPKALESGIGDFSMTNALDEKKLKGKGQLYKSGSSKSIGKIPEICKFSTSYDDMLKNSNLDPHEVTRNAEILKLIDPSGKTGRKNMKSTKHFKANGNVFNDFAKYVQDSSKENLLDDSSTKKISKLKEESAKIAADAHKLESMDIKLLKNELHNLLETKGDYTLEQRTINSAKNFPDKVVTALFSKMSSNGDSNEDAIRTAINKYQKSLDKYDIKLEALHKKLSKSSAPENSETDFDKNLLESYKRLKTEYQNIDFEVTNQQGDGSSVAKINSKDNKSIKDILENNLKSYQKNEDKICFIIVLCERLENEFLKTVNLISETYVKYNDVLTIMAKSNSGENPLVTIIGRIATMGCFVGVACTFLGPTAALCVFAVTAAAILVATGIQIAKNVKAKKRSV